MEIQTEMLRKLKTRREGYSLDRAFYVDADYYRQGPGADLVQGLAVHRP
ncbi:hypothetical protein ACVMB3_002613 [Sinorhizobium meliloti]